MSPYLSEEKDLSIDPSSVYKLRPQMTAAERKEMQMDLLQAYSEQLMNDAELQRFRWYRKLFSGFGMYLGATVPIAFAYVLRPGAFEHMVSQRAIRLNWLSFGLVGLGALSLGFH